MFINHIWQRLKSILRYFYHESKHIYSLAKAFLWPRVTCIFLDFSEAKNSTLATVAPKVEKGGWVPVKRERVSFSDRISEKVQKQKGPLTEKVFLKFLSLTNIHDQSVTCLSNWLLCTYVLASYNLSIWYEHSYGRCTWQWHLSFHFHAKDLCLSIWQILLYMLNLSIDKYCLIDSIEGEKETVQLSLNPMKRLMQVFPAWSKKTQVVRETITELPFGLDYFRLFPKLIYFTEPNITRKDKQFTMNFVRYGWLFFIGSPVTHWSLPCKHALVCGKKCDSLCSNVISNI